MRLAPAWPLGTHDCVHSSFEFLPQFVLAMIQQVLSTIKLLKLESYKECTPIEPEKESARCEGNRGPAALGDIQELPVILSEAQDHREIGY